VLGAIGLALPWLLGIARVLTPFAALGLTALMIGAVGTHLRRKDGHFGAGARPAVGHRRQGRF
jgi:hypothetical protein